MSNAAPRAEVTRVFNAPRALVWQAWTDPACLAQWWGPAGFTNPRFDADPRVGGEIHVIMRGPDGQERAGLGAFVAVEEPSRMVFEMGPLDETGQRMFVALHEVALEDLGERTRVSITVTVPDQGAFGAEHFQGMGSAWREFFNRLEVQVAGGEGPDKVVHHRAFNASREVVWRAWTDPAQLAKWWGPKGFSNPRCEADVRPGGRMHIDMTAPDGSVYPMWGEFEEVAAPERLVFIAGSLDAQGNPMFTTRSTVSFDKMGEQTLVTWLYQVLDRGVMPAEAFEGADEGGAMSLDRLEALVEPDTADRAIVQERTFAAPRKRVWAAWTSADIVGRWWGPNGFTTTIRTMDVRPGGEWDYTMHGPGGVDFPNYVAYQDVRPHHRLRYGHGAVRGGPALFQVTVWMEDLGGQTRLTMRSVFPTKEARDEVVEKYHAIEGGKQTLARLAEMLEAVD